MTVNQLVITASIQGLKPLRYTPAGIPALDLELLHQSAQLETGAKRQVAVQIKALALGGMAEQLAAQAVGSLWTFTGFLAASKVKPQLSKQAVLHIQTLQQVPQVTTALIP